MQVSFVQTFDNKSAADAAWQMLQGDAYNFHHYFIDSSTQIVFQRTQNAETDEPVLTGSLDGQPAYMILSVPQKI